jgi:hypothetical protein
MWYLDNCASNHMCKDKHKFMKLNESIKGNVTFVDHSRISIKGKYTILIRLKNDSHQFISNVYYISIVKSNILSLRQLLEKSYENKMKDLTLTLLNTCHMCMTLQRSSSQIKIFRNNMSGKDNELFSFIIVT